MDVRAEFIEFCGPSVLYAAHRRDGRTLMIEYTIPALDPDDKRKIVGHLRNGLNSVLREAIRRAAKSAYDDAYVRTGQREGDMKQLLKGGRL